MILRKILIWNIFISDSLYISIFNVFGTALG